MRGRRSTRRCRDLVILDIGLPRLDGLELCRRLRGRSEALPIIFVTSREDEFDRVLGLEIGADDYLCKPFSMRELLARVKVLLRRAALAANAAGARAPSAGAGAGAGGRGAGAAGAADADAAEERLLEAGSLRLDLQRYTAAWKGRNVALTVTEFLLLQALARHPGHVKTRDQLMQHAYPDNTFVSDRTIDSHVKRVRRKLEEIDPAFASIETVYGLGYRLPRRTTWTSTHREVESPAAVAVRAAREFAHRGADARVQRAAGVPAAGRPALSRYLRTAPARGRRSAAWCSKAASSPPPCPIATRSTPKRSIASCARSASASTPASASSTPPAASSATPAARGDQIDPLRDAAQAPHIANGNMSIVPSASPQGATRTSRENFLYRFGSSVLLTGRRGCARISRGCCSGRARAGTVLPPLDPGQIAQPASWPEVQAALAGRYGSATRLTRGGQRSVTLYSALPIRSGASGASGASGSKVTGVVLVSQSTYRLLQAIYDVRLRIVEVVMGSMLVAGLLTVVVAATIARPIRRLRRDAAELLDHRGRLTRRFHSIVAPRRNRRPRTRPRRADAASRRTPAIRRIVFSRCVARVQESAGVDPHDPEMVASVEDPAERDRFLAMMRRDVERLERLLSGVREIATIDTQLEREATTGVDVRVILTNVADAHRLRSNGRSNHRYRSARRRRADLPLIHARPRRTRTARAGLRQSRRQRHRLFTRRRHGDDCARKDRRRLPREHPRRRPGHSAHAT